MESKNEEEEEAKKERRERRRKKTEIQMYMYKLYGIRNIQHRQRQLSQDTITIWK